MAINRLWNNRVGVKIRYAGKRMRVRIYLDSSFLISAFEKKLNITEKLSQILDFSYEIFIPSAVINELESIKSKNKKIIAALKLAEGFKKEHSLLKKSDEELLRLADKQSIICTNDKELARKIIEKGGNVIYIRGNKLELRGVLAWNI